MTNYDTPMMYASWEESVTFGDKGPSLTTLIETHRLKVILVGLRADQAIPPHPSPEALYHFLQGSGTMTVDDRAFEVQPGATVIAPSGSKRGIRAVTDIVFIGSTVPAEPRGNQPKGNHGH